MMNSVFRLHPAIVALLIGAMSLAIVACGGPERAPPESIVQTVEVRVPVDDPACPREALARLGPSPDYPDSDAALRAAADLFERVRLLMAGRALRMPREAALSEALAVCAEGNTSHS